MSLGKCPPNPSSKFSHAALNRKKEEQTTRGGNTLNMVQNGHRAIVLILAIKIVAEKTGRVAFQFDHTILGVLCWTNKRGERLIPRGLC